MFMNCHSFNLIKVLSVVLISENNNLSACNALVKIRLLDSGPDVNLGDHLSHSVSDLC